MKKAIIAICIAAMGLSFVGCGKKAQAIDNGGLEGNNRSKVEQKVDKEGTNSFIGKIIKIEDGEFIVEPVKGQDILSSGDKVRVGKNKYLGEEDLKIGDMIKVDYTGGVMESYPLQVKTDKITKVDESYKLELEGDENSSDMDDTVSISRDADPSNFVDHKDTLFDSIGVKVASLLDEYDNISGSVKVDDNMGIMLSGLYVEGYKWDIKIEDPSLVEFLKQGAEKGIVGERQGFDFFAFKGLKKGKTKITIKAMNEKTSEVSSEYIFNLEVI